MSEPVTGGAPNVTHEKIRDGTGRFDGGEERFVSNSLIGGKRRRNIKREES